MVETTIKLSSFEVPNVVLIDTPSKVPNTGKGPEQIRPRIRLRDLGAGTLSDLCDEFRDTAFKLAGKEDPSLLWKAKSVARALVEVLDGKTTDDLMNSGMSLKRAEEIIELRARILKADGLEADDLATPWPTSAS